MCSIFSSLIPNKIVYNSYKAQKFHEQIGYKSSKSYLIYNGVDITRFKPDTYEKLIFRKKLNVNKNTKLIGLIARYDYLKNHGGFIEMSKYVLKFSKNFKFIMAGEDIKNNKKLLSLIREYQLEKYFHLFENSNKIEKIIASLDAVVITSKSESFPNVLIEFYVMWCSMFFDRCG